ncbi:TonB-dependent receptor domain-containing protein [Aurantivibrio infirmus]
MNNSLINNGLLGLIGFAISTSAVSQDNGIEEISVWGTKVNSSSLNLDAEGIAIRQSDHISDLLRTIPGVDVGGAHSLNQRITIRSMDDKDLRITIDGANQNTYMYHHMGNLQIHADILESVDIEVGNNSVISGGLGGAVRFKTRQAGDLLEPGKNWGARVQSSYANNASSSNSIAAYGLLGEQIDVLGYFNQVERENYSVGGEKILDETGAEILGTDGEVRGLEGDLTDALLKFGWNFSDNQRLSLGYESYKDEGDYSYRPDMGLATDLAIANSLNIPLVYPTEFSRDTLTLNYELDLGDALLLNATIFDNESVFWRDERGLISWRPPFATINEGEAENSGVNILAKSLIDGSAVNQTVTYGVELIDYETQYSVNSQNLSGENARNLSFYLEDRIDFDNGLSFIPGLRHDIYDIDSSVVDDTFTKTTGSLAIEYAFLDNFLVRASSTQVFKGPEIGEVFIGAGLNDAPNSNIDAESGLNSEIAFAYQGHLFSAGISFFETQIDDYIYDYAANPGGGRWKDNVGDMELDGYEVYAKLNLGTLQTLLTYSSSDSELSAFSAYANLDGARIDRKQGDTISFNLDYDFSVADLSVHWDFLLVDGINAGSDLDGATLDNAKDGYKVHNIALRWQPSGKAQGLALTLGIDNVFDEFYASQSSRTGVSFHPLFQELYLFDYEPGRNIKATVSFRF